MSSANKDLPLCADGTLSVVTVPCGCGDGTHEAFLPVSSFERRQCGRLVEEGKTEGEGGGVGPISQFFFFFNLTRGGQA